MTEQSANIVRKTDRFSMALPVRVKDYSGKKPDRVTLSDLSAVGCQLTPAHSFRTGSQLLVKLPGLDYRPVTVVWKRQDSVGIKFVSPLHPRSVEEFARLLAEMPPQST